MPSRKQYSTKTVLFVCLVTVAVYLVGINHIQVAGLQNKRERERYSVKLNVKTQPTVLNKSKPQPLKPKNQTKSTSNTNSECDAIITLIEINDLLDFTKYSNLLEFHRDVILPLLHTCKEQGATSSQQCSLKSSFNLNEFPLLKLLFVIECHSDIKVSLSLKSLKFDFTSRMLYSNSLPFTIARLRGLPSEKSFNDGNRILLMDPNDGKQTWKPHLKSNFSKFDWDLTEVTGSSLVDQLTAVTSSNVNAVIGTHSEILVLGAYQQSRLKIVFSLCYRGMTYQERLKLEQFFTVAGVRFIVYRSIQDSVQETSVVDLMPESKFKIARDEIPKIVSEVLLYNEMQSSVYRENPVVELISKHTPEPAYSGVRYGKPWEGFPDTETNFEIYAEKTKYDPAHFTFGPFGIQNGDFIVFGDQAEKLDLQRKYFGKYTENDAHYYPVRVRVEKIFSVDQCSKYVDETLQVHYPWVRDNIYHSHNDNFWPIFSRILKDSSGSQHAMLLLKTKRTNTPVTAYADILSRLFVWSSWLEDLPKDEMICFKSAVWGRPKRLFSTHYNEMKYYGTNQVLMHWTRLVYKWFAISIVPWRKPTSNSDIKVTWLDRKKPKRVLKNSAVLTKSLESRKLSYTTCCNNLSFQEQVMLISNTNILIGTHGAGLLHIIFLQPGSLVYHLSPRRLNYHEQVVIERIAFASNISYLNSHLNTGPAEAATWNSNYFSVPPEDLQSAVDEAIVRYYVLHS